MAFNKNIFFSLFTALLLSSCNILIPDGKDITEEGFAPGYTEPKISIADTSVIESSDLTFTVTLSKTYSSAITVDYTTSNGSASAGSDYTATSGTLTIAKGATSATITVPVTDDSGDEANETLTITLSNASKGTFETSSATGTIIDDDGEPTISINDVSVAENAGPATFTVTLSNPSSSTVTVDYATSDGTATTADSDYTAASGTLTFNPGDTTKTFNVTITNDTKNEANETYTVTISNATNATISDATGTGTITNDDAVPSLSVNDVSVAENVGAGVATFTVTLSAASGQTVTVDYATSDGTATTADSDYTATSGTLTFNPGDTTKTFNVTIANDAKNEANETYTVTISNPNNATISDATGTGTITNDDAVPSLSVNDVTVDEDAGTATFTVTQSAISGQPVTVDYATSNGTATAGSDYTAASGTLTFSAGDTTKTFNVTITNDTSDEADETYTVTISNPSNATISDATGTGTITDNDVTVDQTDNDNTASGFGGGSHTGTVYSGDVLSLGNTDDCDATNTNCAELDESWTPQWDNLVSYWKMENNWEDSKESFDGIPNNSPTFTGSAKIGSYSGSFNGTDQSITASLVSTARSSLTMMAWFKTDDPSNDGQMIFFNGSDNAGDGYGFSVNKENITTGNLYILYGSIAWYDTGFTLADPNWHHAVLTLEADGTPKFYLDGQLIYTGASGLPDQPTLKTEIAKNDYAAQRHFEGDIDEVAFWETRLTADEIALIYSRQSAKYSGEMKSRVMDSQSTSSSWTNLDWITTLPFGKELPNGGGSANSESSTDYTSLAAAPSPYDGLMDGIVGLWHMNETSLNGTSSEVRDTSGTGNHGTSSGTFSGTKGKLSTGYKFTGSNFVSIPNDSSLSGFADWSFSVWLYPNTMASHQAIVEKLTGSGTWSYMLYGGTNVEVAKKTFRPHIGGYYGSIDYDVSLNRWHHVVCTYKSSTGSVNCYINGKAYTIVWSGSAPPAGYVMPSTTGPLNIANTTRGVSKYSGLMDELAMWDRELSSAEILQLYRRGANRIIYQVRTCSTSNCSDQDVQKGHGWKGPGGNYLTYFSELYNNSSVSSSCAIPQACAASELSLDGDVQTSSPSLRFDDFGADGIYMNNNRYFQYRVIMESDDENTACNGGTSTCHPELKSVEIGPAHTYEQ